MSWGFNSGMVAIDMGSSNTSIYQVGTGLVLHEPSVIALSNDKSRKVKEVGSEAKKLIGKTADNTIVLSPVFESEIQDEKATALMLDKFLNKITLKKMSARPEVVFSVPCGVQLPSIRKLEKVLVDCDVSRFTFIESPVLSALGMGIPLTESSPCFIVNIGGGTTEIAAVSLDGVICGISVNMGGLSIDTMLHNHLDKIFGLRVGPVTCEKMKIDIGSLVAGDNTHKIVNGRDSYTGEPKAISVSARDIQEPIKIFFDKIFQIMKMVMSKLPSEVSADIRNNGVYFCGGVARTLGLEEYFYSKTGMKSNFKPDPELCTVMGAGIVASNKQLIKKLRLNKN